MPTTPDYPSAATPLTGNELIPVWQNGEQCQTPVAKLSQHAAAEVDQALNRVQNAVEWPSYGQASAATGWVDGDRSSVSAMDTGTHSSLTGDVGGMGGQTPNAGLFIFADGVGLVRLGDSDGQLAAAWAEGVTPPDPDDPDSKSAKRWAGEAADLRTFLKRVTPDFLFANMVRFRVGNRLYATWDAVIGFYFRKGRLSSNFTVDDNTALSIASRLLGGSNGGWFKNGKTEAVADKSSLRIRIGNRLYATLDRTRGWYPRKATLPQTAVIDDDLNTSIVSRLLASGLASFFKRLPAESGGGTLRFRWGNRLIGQWTKAGGMQWSRQTLPAAGTYMSDQPTVLLADRLGGSTGGLSSSTSYLAMAMVDANGKNQITTRRRSDGQRFNLTTGPSAYRLPFVTNDDKVIFYGDAEARWLYNAANANGGTLWPVDPDDIIEAYGDSLTAGAGSSGSGAGQGAYPKQLKDRLGAVVSAVNNRGVGGQTSIEIEARDGGAPMLATFPSNQIAASGTTALNSWSTSLITNQGPGNMTGTFVDANGVPIAGTLSVPSFDGSGRATAMNFARTTAGSVANVSANVPFVPDLGVTGRPRCKLFIYGRNNINQAQIMASLAAGVGYQTAYVPRYLIGYVLAGPSDTESTRSTIATINAAILDQYPGNVVDTNAPPTAGEMTLLGFTMDAVTYVDGTGVPTGRTDAADINGRASGLFTFYGNPSPGETVTINGTTITFVASGASGAQVNIGGSIAATASNLATYINANSGLGVTAIATTPSSTTYLIVTAITGGTAGNSLAIAEASAVMSVSSSTLTGGSAYGVIPSGMRSGAQNGNGDYLHLNNAGYALWALRFYRAIYAKGWFPTLAAV